MKLLTETEVADAIRDLTLLVLHVLTCVPSGPDQDATAERLIQKITADMPTQMRIERTRGLV